jgi:hypothetical protein
MEMDLITRADLEKFRMDLLADLRSMISEIPNPARKPWLKGAEVRKLLSISDGSLQNLRVTGKLKSSKIGGIHYYRYEDIERMMNGKHG